MIFFYCHSQALIRLGSSIIGGNKIEIKFTPNFELSSSKSTQTKLGIQAHLSSLIKVVPGKSVVPNMFKAKVVATPGSKMKKKNENSSQQLVEIKKPLKFCNDFDNLR